MNYRQHYNKLITRANNRTLNGYGEWHHIQPKCLGGSDAKKNLAFLTAREHFVAHQLLVKMYPRESKLIYAVRMMTFNSNGERINNRMYEWLKKRHSKAASDHAKKRIGSKNGMYGKHRSAKDKAAISRAQTGRIPTLEQRTKMSEERRKRHWITNGLQTRHVNRNKPIPPGWSIGRPHNINTHVGEKVSCPSCGRQGGLGIMKRWHFDNCRACKS